MSTPRVLSGQNLSGAYGFWVSKNGFDVTTCNVMQMAFSSDVKNLKPVATGSITSAPTSGVAPFGSGVLGGAKQTLTTVGYGRTISPPPFVIAIGSASSWPLPLSGSAAQLGYLNSVWHTFVFEQPSFLADGSYGPTIKRQAPPSVTGDVDSTWASARFIANVYSTGVDFITNCQNNVVIKYLILEAV